MVKAVVHTTLPRAGQIVGGAVRDSLLRAGSRLRAGWRGRMREDRGEERRDVRMEVTGRGFQRRLRLWGGKVQTVIDEEGLEARKARPPYRAGSKLYSWVTRNVETRGVDRRSRRATLRHETRTRARGGRLRSRVESYVSRVERTSYLISRAIFNRGISARRPAGRTVEAERANVFNIVQSGFTIGVGRLNHG